MNIGIVGHAQDKFTPETEKKARQLISDMLLYLKLLGPDDYVVSGGCHLGGIDWWAEEIAKAMGIKTKIFKPDVRQWNPPNRYGYKERNLDIARTSDILHIIVVESYPDGYKGQRFDECYHCNKDNHVKSGGCWTGWEAKKLGKEVIWHILKGE